MWSNLIFNMTLLAILILTSLVNTGGSKCSERNCQKIKDGVWKFGGKPEIGGKQTTHRHHHVHLRHKKRDAQGWMDNDSVEGPFIDPHHSRNVTAYANIDTRLTCRVYQLGDKTVSWIKHKELLLLAVGRYTYTSDLRFEAIHLPASLDWILQIKSPTTQDSGVYECQVSTTPHLSQFIFLTVEEASTVIIGGPDMYLEAGSTINLTCVVNNTPRPPHSVIWDHEGEEMTYQGPRQGVSLITDKAETTVSSLILTRARISDSGKYSCTPENAPSTSVNLHVSQGHMPAELSQADPLAGPPRGLVVIPLLLLCNSIS